MRWIRLYTEIVDDPKMQRMAADSFRFLINLWCVAGMNDGKIPPVEDVAFRLRIPEEECNRRLHELVRLGLLDSEEGALSPHNWNERQYASDHDSAQRKRRSRMSQRCHGELAVTVTAGVTTMSQPNARDGHNDVTASEQNRTDTEQTQNRTEQSAAVAAPVDSLVSEICQEMRTKHRKKTGLGGLELERELCSQSGDAIDPPAVLRAIRDRWRLGCEREWARSDTPYWPNLLDWLRRRRYLDPAPAETDHILDRPRKSALEAMIDRA